MLWWLSFADPDLPQGQQFLGVTIMEAPSFVMAVTLTHTKDINPGGEVQGMQLDDGVELDAKWLNRLLSQADIALLEREIEKRTVN